MKILYIAPYFSLSLGGVSEVVSQAAKHLVQRGHQVTVLAGDYAAETKNLEAYPFELIFLPSYSRWGFHVTPTMVRWLRAHLHKYDVVHLHEFRTFQNVIASFFASNVQKPFFLTGHGTIPNIIERQLAKKYFDLLFQKKILRSIDTFVGVSPKEVKDYHQLGVQHSKIRLVYNGVYIPQNLKFGENSPDAFRQKEQDFIVLFLGRLHKRKKIDVLIRAFAILCQSVPDACLILAGPDGGIQTQLEALSRTLAVHNQVSFPGPVYGEEKEALYRSASVLAYPSAYEIFGLVPFEALLQGTPVVVTEGPGMGDIVEEAQAGTTVPIDDPAALAKALAWVLEHPIDARQQVLAGQKFIHEHLAWSRIVLHLEEIYQERISQ